MTTNKPWYLSRTIWASIVTILTGAAGLTGLPLDGLWPALGLAIGLSMLYRYAMSHRTPVAWAPAIVGGLVATVMSTVSSWDTSGRSTSDSESVDGPGAADGRGPVGGTG